MRVSSLMDLGVENGQVPTFWLPARSFRKLFTLDGGRFKLFANLVQGLPLSGWTSSPRFVFLASLQALSASSFFLLDWKGGFC